MHLEQCTYIDEVTSLSIAQALEKAEVAVGDGRSLAGTGFWRAVAEVKAKPDLVDEYGERIARIDRQAFENWAFFTIGITPGTVLMLAGLIVGTFLIGLTYSMEGFAAVVIFYVGFGVILVTTHGLGHLVVGAAVGIHFTHWFIGTIVRPQPGVKTDYESYLASPAASRARMHASGAVVTKLVPFALIGAAIAADLPTWAVWALPFIGVVTIISDVLWSTTASDWKKYRREMAYVSDAT